MAEGRYTVLRVRPRRFLAASLKPPRTSSVRRRRVFGSGAAGRVNRCMSCRNCPMSASPKRVSPLAVSAGSCRGIATSPAIIVPVRLGVAVEQAPVLVPAAGASVPDHQDVGTALSSLRHRLHVRARSGPLLVFVLASGLAPTKIQTRWLHPQASSRPRAQPLFRARPATAISFPNDRAGRAAPRDSFSGRLTGFKRPSRCAAASCCSPRSCMRRLVASMPCNDARIERRQ